MRIREIVATATERLRGSLTASISLSFFILLVYIALLIVGKMVTLFFQTMLMEQRLSDEIMLSSFLGGLFTLLLMRLLLSPLLLNIKVWYQNMDGGFHSVKTAFSYFKNGRDYVSAVWFCLVRFFFLFITFFLPLLPAVLLYTILRVGMVYFASDLEAFSAILLLLTFLFALIGVLFSLYFAMGFFFTDYLYQEIGERNPVRAMRISHRIMKGKRARFLRLIVILFPYLFLCLLIAPIPFAVPNIETAFAVFAKEEINQKKKEGAI